MSKASSLNNIAEEEEEELLTGRVKGKFTSQDDILFAVDKLTQKGTLGKREFEQLPLKEQWRIFKPFMFSRQPKEEGSEEYFFVIMGRTIKEWLQLVIFYLLYYGGLVAFTSIFFALFYLKVSVETPGLSDQNSIMTGYDNGEASPSMGMRPMPDFETTLITFQANKPETYLFYSDHVQAFLKSEYFFSFLICYFFSISVKLQRLSKNQCS